MTIIPRKFSNSKGQNFFTEISNTKKWNKLMREMREVYKASYFIKKDKQVIKEKENG